MRQFEDLVLMPIERMNNNRYGILKSIKSDNHKIVIIKTSNSPRVRPQKALGLRKREYHRKQTLSFDESLVSYAKTVQNAEGSLFLVIH